MQKKKLTSIIAKVFIFTFCVIHGWANDMWLGGGMEIRGISGFWGQESGPAVVAGIEWKNIKGSITAGTLSGYQDMVSYFFEGEVMFPVYLFRPWFSDSSWIGKMTKNIYLAYGWIWGYHSFLLDYQAMELLAGIKIEIKGSGFFQHTFLDFYGRWRPWNTVAGGETTMAGGVIAGWKW